MAVNGARRTLQFCSTSARTTLLRSTTPTSKAPNAASVFGLSTSKPASAFRFSSPKLNFSRLPVELGAALSLMPLHSVTASALFTSLLSVQNDKWGCLSEGFATPL